MNQYILKGKTAVACGDIKEWGEWFEKADRKVARETIGGVEVSTVFLGLDHSFGGGPPMLFETMVFGGTLDQEQDRCTTWDEAEAMHKAMVERVKGHNASGNGQAGVLACPVDRRVSRGGAEISFMTMGETMRRTVAAMTANDQASGGGGTPLPLQAPVGRGNG